MEPRTIGRYNVLSYLGRGGMAEVYRCQLSGLGGFDKIVVVKRIMPDLVGDEEFVNMFLDEARLVARLTHPNIVQVFEVDHDQGLPFLTMEFVRGPTLRQIFDKVGREQAIPIPDAVRIISDVCSGLHYTHTFKGQDGQPLNIVHRDVSPPNIILSADGVARMLDFGVAKAEARLAQTRAGMVKGKLAYLAPEQIKRQEVDHRADVFATGICLYRATTGQFPFYGRSEVEQMTSILQGEYRPPTEVVPDYPAELERIVRWTLEQSVDDRCPSSQDLHNALQDFANKEGLNARHDAVSDWIGTLFPDRTIFDGRSLTTGGVGSGTSSPIPFPSPTTGIPGQSTPGSGVQAGITGQLTPLGTGSNAFQAVPSVVMQQPSAASKALWIVLSVGLAAVVATAVILAAVVLTKDSRGGGGGGKIVDTEQADATLRKFLDEAEGLVEQRQYRLALDVLQRAKRLPSQDMELNTRLASLNINVQKEYNLAQAKRLLTLGDADGAIKHAQKVLSLEGNHVEAKEILAKARKLKQGKK